MTRRRGAKATEREGEPSVFVVLDDQHSLQAPSALTGAQEGYKTFFSTATWQVEGKGQLDVKGGREGWRLIGIQDVQV